MEITLRFIVDEEDISKIQMSTLLKAPEGTIATSLDEGTIVGRLIPVLSSSELRGVRGFLKSAINYIDNG